MTRLLASAWMCLIVLAPCSALAAGDLAGKVERLLGAAFATTGSLSRPLEEGAEIYTGDVVATSDNARLRVRLTDGALMTLGANSQMTIEEVSNDGKQPTYVEVTSGAFLAATPKTNAPEHRALEVSTPVAILGVRGTEIWGDQQEDQLSVCLLSGTEVTVDTSSGLVLLADPLLGTDVRPGQAPTPPKKWSESRLAAAKAKVAFE